MTAIARDPDGRSYDLELASRIDHTLLRPEAVSADVDRLCAEAAIYGFAAVCVHPLWVRRALAALAASAGPAARPAVCTVAGFPHGAQPSAVKAAEARRAVADGAAEVDMVIPVGALKEGDDARVRRHIGAVVDACAGRALVKVILETCLLDDAEKRRACRAAVEEGAAFVKTSTGFARGGATEADVRLLREAVGPRVGVKAAGGIRDRAAALRMLGAGASRIGTSSGVALVLLGDPAGAP
jgi:deoxyribose-phosphate aldolase